MRKLNAKRIAAIETELLAKLALAPVTFTRMENYDYWYVMSGLLDRKLITRTVTGNYLGNPIFKLELAH